MQHVSESNEDTVGDQPPLHFQLLHSGTQAGTTGCTTSSSTQPGAMVWLHSLRLSSDAYVGVAQAAVDRAAAATGRSWVAVLVEHRCHGGSRGLPGLQPPHTVEAMASDTLRLLLWGKRRGRWGQVEVVVGHSIGALVALEMGRRLGEAASAAQDAGEPLSAGADAGGGTAMRDSQRTAGSSGSSWSAELTSLRELGVPQQVWALDGRAFSISPDTPLRRRRRELLAAMHAVPEPVTSAEVLLEAARAYLRAAGVQGAAPSLQASTEASLEPNPCGPGLVRRYQPQAVMEMLQSYQLTDCSALLRCPPAGCTVVVVRGLESDEWRGEDGEPEVALVRQQQAAGAAVRLHELAGADHFLALTHQDELLDVMGAEFVALK